MPNTIYTGADVTTNVNGATKRLESIAIELGRDKFLVTPSDPIAVERGSGPPDCNITVVGEDSDDADAMTSADVASLILSGAAPSALAWTDKAATPASKLPPNFFDYFPLSTWRFDSISFGSGGPTDVNKWTAKLTPNNQNTIHPLEEEA